jgi:hypothetical protein
MNTTADIETWMIGRGWLIVAICATVLFVAFAIFAVTDEPGDDHTCPPVDLDTELRRLIEQEAEQ